VGTDGEIFRRSVSEPGAFADIFDRYVDVVLAYARRRLGHAEGEEITARVFMIAFEKRAKFDPGAESAKPWLLGIASNLIRRRFRDERERLSSLAKVSHPLPSEPIDDPARLDAERLRPALADALRRLSLGEREAFLLVALGDLTYEETARALRVPIGTIRSRIHRARAHLREHISGLGGIPDGTANTDDG
jgi:RNA polymerase sigma-70 factor (ECF subfamily)